MALRMEFSSKPSVCTTSAPSARSSLALLDDLSRVRHRTWNSEFLRRERATEPPCWPMPSWDHVRNSPSNISLRPRRAINIWNMAGSPVAPTTEIVLRSVETVMVLWRKWMRMDNSCDEWFFRTRMCYQPLISLTNGALWKPDRYVSIRTEYIVSWPDHPFSTSRGNTPVFLGLEKNSDRKLWNYRLGTGWSRKGPGVDIFSTLFMQSPVSQHGGTFYRQKTCIIWHVEFDLISIVGVN
jgi:hypothetical protein